MFTLTVNLALTLTLTNHISLSIMVNLLLESAAIRLSNGANGSRQLICHVGLDM